MSSLEVVILVIIVIFLGAHMIRALRERKAKAEKTIPVSVDPRVWDLFLQVFDDGRLTDTLGQVADFRHCLIILTTNLGATMHQSSGFGFASPPASLTSDQVTRAIRETYRPEFQNRLDKIIVFRPLTRELMRVILRKELARVLERRGLKDRAWGVAWDS